MTFRIGVVLLVLAAACHPQVRRQPLLSAEGSRSHESSLQRSSRSLTKLTSAYPYYHTSDEIRAEAQRLVSGCAASFQTIEDGEVSMDVVRVNATDVPQNKVFILFGEHSRELIGLETGLALLQELCGGSQRSKATRKDSEFLLVLNGNPRSRQKVEEGDFCLRTNPAGVDLNRNWDEEWQQESAGFGKDSNPGPAPFSEPETRIFRRLVSEYQPTTYLSVHSDTLGLYMPWAFDETHLADRNQKAMMDLLQELDEAHCHCPYGAAGKEVGYSCPGTSLDWIYDKLKTPYSFAFEIFVGNDLAQKLKDRWEDEKSHSAALLQQGHLAHAVNFFQEHPSDFVQLSSADVSLSRDCFAIYNPSSEELFHSTVKNWVSVYLEMAQKIAKNLQKDKTGEGA